MLFLSENEASSVSMVDIKENLPHTGFILLFHFYLILSIYCPSILPMTTVLITEIILTQGGK